MANNNSEQNGSFCPKCSSKLAAGARFCSMCGKRIDRNFNPKYDSEEQEDSEVSSYKIDYYLNNKNSSGAMPEHGAELAIYVPDIDKTIKLISMKNKLTIGSSEDCDIVANRRYVSKKHAILYYDAEKASWMLCDNYSTNGTFVNNRQVEENMLVQLKLGDKIELSKDFQIQII